MRRIKIIGWDAYNFICDDGFNIESFKKQFKKEHLLKRVVIKQEVL